MENKREELLERLGQLLLDSQELGLGTEFVFLMRFYSTLVTEQEPNDDTEGMINYALSKFVDGTFMNMFGDNNESEVVS